MKLAPALSATHRDAGALSDPLSFVDELIARAEAKKNSLMTLGKAVPAVVTFEVSGQRFALEKRLLEKDPQSLLFVLAEQHFSSPPAGTSSSDTSRSPKRRKTEAADRFESVEDEDASVITIPDKDPGIFGKIINVVRGYKNAIPDNHWREACEPDVEFYGLHRSWYEQFPAPEELKFTVRTSPSFVTSATTYGVAGEYYVKGQHIATFAVTLQGAEKVAIGVEPKASDEAAEGTAQSMHGEAYNRALYWNDGNVTTFFSAAKSVASGFPYKASAVIRVFLDADEGTVRWAVRGCDCVAMERLPRRESGYAFCAISQKGSQINIINGV